LNKREFGGDAASPHRARIPFPAPSNLLRDQKQVLIQQSYLKPNNTSLLKNSFFLKNQADKKRRIHFRFLLINKRVCNGSESELAMLSIHNLISQIL